jgi:hypothetical protein
MDEYERHDYRTNDIRNKRLDQPSLHLRFGDAGQLAPRWTKECRRKTECPNAYLTMTATRIASQLMGKCSIISPLNCAETLRNAAKRSRGE